LHTQSDLTLTSSLDQFHLDTSMLTDSCTWEDDCYSGQSFKSISMATLLDFGHMQADMSILAAEKSTEL
jgi:hypothetical protein